MRVDLFVSAAEDGQIAERESERERERMKMKEIWMAGDSNWL